MFVYSFERGGEELRQVELSLRLRSSIIPINLVIPITKMVVEKIEEAPFRASFALLSERSNQILEGDKVAAGLTPATRRIQFQRDVSKGQWKKRWGTDSKFFAQSQHLEARLKPIN
ncbi:hypothetical protein AAC387_Pa01g2383 [Persea americana]